jgi:hypothetical protein
MSQLLLDTVNSHQIAIVLMKEADMLNEVT